MSQTRSSASNQTNPDYVIEFACYLTKLADSLNKVIFELLDIATFSSKKTNESHVRDCLRLIESHTNILKFKFEREINYYKHVIKQQKKEIELLEKMIKSYQNFEEKPVLKKVPINIRTIEHIFCNSGKSLKLFSKMINQ